MILFLIIAVIAAGLVPMMIEVRLREFTFLNSKNLFIAYYVVLLGVSGLLTLASGPSQVFARDYSATPWVYQDGLWVALAGIIAFQFGYYLQRSAVLPVPRLLRAEWASDRVVIVVSVCYLAGALAILGIIREAGGLSGFLAARESWRAGGLKGHGIQMLAATALVANASHILFLHYVKPNTSRKTVGLILLAYVISSIPAFILGFRSSVAIPFLQLFLLWNMRRRSVSVAGTAIVLSLFALTFTLYGIVRSLPPGVSLNLEQMRRAAVEQPDLALAVVARTRGVEILADVVNRLRETGEYDTSPKSLIEAATIMIPSGLWANKPLSAGERFSTYFYGEDFVYTRGMDSPTTVGGVSPTIAAEFYWHMGLAGVVLGLFLLGLTVRLVYHTIRQYVWANGAVLFYATLYTSIGLVAESFQSYLNATVLDAIMLTILLLGLSARWSPRTIAMRAPEALSTTPSGTG